LVLALNYASKLENGRELKTARDYRIPALRTETAAEPRKLDCPIIALAISLAPDRFCR
jgi:hypothetical protein